MASRVVLISDDTDFFDYIRTRLELRKSDELFMFKFDDIPEKLHLLTTSVLIINSEGVQAKALELLKIIKGVPSIVMSYNEDAAFKKKCYREGALDYMPLLTSVSEFRARILPVFAVSDLLKKNNFYRDILVKNNVLTLNNEVFLDYNSIIDSKLKELDETSGKAVFGAIAPNEKTKFLLKPNIIETMILNNIRKNDILMNYAPNKYFIFMLDTNVDSAQKIWAKITEQMPEKIYAGFVNVSNQKRQQLIDGALNKLHESINHDKGLAPLKPTAINGLNSNSGDSSYYNFKMFRQEFGQKIEQVITPVFYQIQQKYSGKMAGVTLEQGSGEGYGTFYIKGKHSSSCFRITSPGFSKINIDITYQKASNNIDAKRITLEPEELEAGLLGDLLEQFITEYRSSNND